MKWKWVISLSVVLVAAVSWIYIASTSASTGPDYGPDQYGDTDILFRGDLTPSGLGIDDMRPSTAHWHKVRFRRVDTGETSDWINAVQYDIIETKPTDDFSRRSGYLVIPVDEQTIKQIAGMANGNPDWVWDIVSNRKPAPVLGKSKLTYYTADDIPMVSFGEVVALSGGGSPVILEDNEREGINKPRRVTEFSTTPWPVINSIRFNGDEVK